MLLRSPAVVAWRFDWTIEWERSETALSYPHTLCLYTGAYSYFESGSLQPSTGFFPEKFGYARHSNRIYTPIFF